MKKAILYAGGIGIIAFALYRYIMIEKKLFTNINFKIADISFNSVSIDKISANITLLFTSTTDIEAKVNSINADVTIGGNSVGKVTNNKPFVVPAKGSNFVELKLDFNPKLVVGNALRGGNTMLALNGYANVKSGIIRANIPIDYSQNVGNIVNIKNILSL